jgi:DNA (cytosine-5)-methyltransferase 1
VWGIDFDEEISNLYRHNIGSILNMDVTKLRTEYLDVIPTRKERERDDQILIVQISPPCQEHSNANLHKNKTSDRANLIHNTQLITHYLQPEYIIVENVPSFGKSDTYQLWKSLQVNYIESHDILNAYDYDIPQSRKRFISVLSRCDMPIVGMGLVKKHNNKTSWYGFVERFVPYLEETTLSKSQIPVVERLSEECFPIVIERVGFYGEPKYRTKYEPIWTLRSHLATDGKGGVRSNVINIVTSDRKVYKADTRCFSRWQGFPDEYEWSNNFGLNVKAIGNSVPPMMIAAVCDEIVRNNSNEEIINKVTSEVCGWKIQNRRRN